MLRQDVIALARSHLRYEPDTGSFTWLTPSRKNPARAGTSAVHIVNEAYWYITLPGLSDMPASRLAWAMTHGEFPARRLSFIDGNTLNCAIHNLEQPRPSLKALSPQEAQARVLELLTLDEATGVFRARADRMEWRAGQAVGFVADGYLSIGIDGHRFLAHRLVWLVLHGEWPLVVDHIDGCGLNNRPTNLRSVTQAINVQNQRRARSTNKTGLLGVSQRADTGKFLAQIGVDGVHVRIGEFDNAAEAHRAYVAAKRKLHEGCTI